VGTIARGAKAGGGTNFNSGQVIDPAEVNTDFNTIVTEVNGLLDDGNIESGTIPGAKTLRFTGIAIPSNPASGDLLVYKLNSADDLMIHNSSGQKLLIPLSLGSSISEIVCGPYLSNVDGTERTSNSGGAVDLSTLTVSLPTTHGFVIVGRYRKTAGAAAAAQLGLKLNGTQIFANAAMTSATNQAEDGMFCFGADGLFGARPGIANYTHSSSRFVGWAAPSAGGTTVFFSNAVFAAAIPSATITQVIITANSGSGLQTVAVKDVSVYRLETGA
jgi:hypothetical protein